MWESWASDGTMVAELIADLEEALADNKRLRRALVDLADLTGDCCGGLVPTKKAMKKLNSIARAALEDREPTPASSGS